MKDNQIDAMVSMNNQDMEYDRLANEWDYEAYYYKVDKRASILYCSFIIVTIVLITAIAIYRNW